MSPDVAAKPQILVVEDDATFAAYMAKRLDQLGYGMEVVNDGLKALILLRRQQPDVIVIDLALPALDGMGLLRRLREEKLAVGVPVIVLTGRFSASDVEEATELGVTDYMVKPFQEAAFFSLLAKHVGQARPSSDNIVLFDS